MNLRPLTFLTWILPLLFIGAFLPGETTAADREELRVMSFNVRYGTAKDGENHWDKRKDFLIDTIAAFDPDFLGTQETLDFQKTFIEERLAHFTGVGAGRDDGSKKGEMAALFYRTDRFELLDEGHFWLSEKPAVPGSKSWDTSLPRVVSWVKLKDKKSASSRPVFFLNTHFDHRGQQAREESARLVIAKLNELAKDCDIVISGDFNASTQSNPYKIIFDAKDGASDQALLFDTYALAGKPDPRGETTFNGFELGRYKGARIDWIGVSKNWKVKSAEIDRTERDGRLPSDHYPVNAVITRSTE